MPKYVIEREVPGAGQLNAEQMQAISQTSCGVLRKLGPDVAERRHVEAGGIAEGDLDRLLIQVAVPTVGQRRSAGLVGST